MAFGVAGGYTNLPSGNFTPQIFSQRFRSSSEEHQW